MKRHGDHVDVSVIIAPAVKAILEDEEAMPQTKNNIYDTIKSFVQVMHHDDVPMNVGSYLSGFHEALALCASHPDIAIRMLEDLDRHAPEEISGIYEDMERIANATDWEMPKLEKLPDDRMN